MAMSLRRVYPECTLMELSDGGNDSSKVGQYRYQATFDFGEGFTVLALSYEEWAELREALENDRVVFDLEVSGRGDVQIKF